MSEAMRGEKNSFYGKTHTSETLVKMSEAHKEYKFTDTHKQKLSKAAHRNYESKKDKMIAASVQAHAKHYQFIDPNGQLVDLIKKIPQEDREFDNINNYLYKKQTV
jgi:hypothetical protein